MLIYYQHLIIIIQIVYLLIKYFMLKLRVLLELQQVVDYYLVFKEMMKEFNYGQVLIGQNFIIELNGQHMENGIGY